MSNDLTKTKQVQNEVSINHIQNAIMVSEEALLGSLGWMAHILKSFYRPKL